MVTELKLVAIVAIGNLGVTVAVLSDQVILGLFTLIGSFITAVVTVIIAIRGTNRKLDDQKDSIDKLTVNNDGKLTELMKAVSRADKAEGKAEGKAEEKLEAAAAVGVQAIAKADAEKTTKL